MKNIIKILTFANICEHRQIFKEMPLFLHPNIFLLTQHILERYF